MTTAMHPDDLELFEYVEGDLEPARRPEVAAHVAACGRCAEEVRFLEAGKEALRATPLLQLPQTRRKAILSGLPRQAERERRGFSFLSTKRLVAVLTPVAAVVAVVAILASTGGNGESEEAAAPAPQELARASKSADEPGAGAAEAAPAEAAPVEGAPSFGAAPPSALRAVSGTPDEVADFLRGRGFDASVVKGTVEVRGAEPAALEQVLAELPDGGVQVVVAAP